MGELQGPWARLVKPLHEFACCNHFRVCSLYRRQIAGG